MHTGQLHYYEKCKIRNVAYADKMEYLSFDVESESGAHLNTISVCNRTVKDDIRKLLSHPTIRLFWAYGMVDVDVWKKVRMSMLSNGAHTMALLANMK